MAGSNPYDIPGEMRDFADRSVSQARKAFETFMGAIKKTSGTVDGATSSAQTAAKDVASKAVTFAEKNVSTAFDLAEKLVHAKDVQEVMRLQADYLRAQLETIQAQAKDLGETVQKAAGLKNSEGD